MKKIAAFVLLFVSINVSAQNDAAEDTTAKPAITAIGKPDGNKSEMKIGKDGGSFTSSDRKIELIIPEGAVSKKTTFSIQPVTNLMPNGNGKAYHLEPSGIQFQKPVELVFHYDPEESEDSMQLLMGIAMQDDKGQWYGLNKFTLDTVAKTISGNINHFSIWATFDKLKLIFSPPGNKIKVKGWGLLFILGVDARTPEQREQDNEFIAKFGRKGFGKFIQEEITSNDLSPLSSWKAPQKVIWCVNNIIKGNAEFGTLEKGIVDESHGSSNKYKAPANVPDWNPVTISAELVGASFIINGLTIKNPPLETEILIYDNAYEVTMISHADGYAGTVAGQVTYKDTGSFVVEINGKHTRIIEKKNKNSNAEAAYKGSCKVDQVKPGYGSIHLPGGEKIIVTPATPGQPAIVVIIFPRCPVEYPLLNFDCPPIERGSRYGGFTAMANAIAAKWVRTYPINVKFEAKEGSQIIEEFGKPNSDLFYRVEVRQLDD